MINFGVYINTLTESKLFSDVCAEINRAFSENEIIDASIFYDQIASIKTKPPCGLFHSSDLWNFSGHLFILSLNSSMKIENIANNIEMILGYGWDDRNVMSILDILSVRDVKTIAYSKDLVRDFYRVTGKPCIGYSSDMKNTITMILESKNE